MEIDSSGLKYRSMTELLANAELTEQQTRKYEGFSCENLFKSFKKMTDQAKKARGDLEEQYKYLIIAGELAHIILKHKKFPNWESSKRLILHDDFTKAISEASGIQTVLEKKYDNLRFRLDQIEKAEAAKKASLSKPEMKYHRPMLTPRELVRKVENENPKKAAVIFDIRKDQSDRINYFRSEFITVIQVPHSLIDSSLTYISLRDNLSVSQRGLLSRLNTYDFVILMDDLTPPLANASPLPQTTLSFMFRALTEYARHDSKLRERPMFMEGGFELWKEQYGLYTIQETPVTPRSQPPDDMDRAISRHKESVVSSISYPDLMAPSHPPPQPSPTPQYVPQPQQPSKVPLIPPKPPPTEPQQPPPQRPGFGVYPSIGPTPGLQRPIIPPTLDRPGAPIFNPSPAISKPLPPAPQIPIWPDRTIKPSPMPERPAEPSPTRREPERTNGGELKRPPLLDRATKPTQQQHQPVTKEYEAQLQSIYEQMKMAIERSSRRANPPLPGGTTGLFNMGNTCFMSATLQCLFQTPGLNEVFTKRQFVSKVNTESKLGSKGIVSAGFAALMDAIWSGQYDAIKPARFLQLFADEISSVLSDGKQHDASEFQIFLLDALHEDTNQAKRMGFEQNYRGGAKIREEAADFIRRQAMFSSSPVNRMFGGVSVSEIRCRTCGESSATFEENTIISVELTSTNQCTLDSCLRSHFSETNLDGDSRWNCPKCRQPRIAVRRSKMWALPSVMIIHLKRFALFNGEFEKNAAAVTFDPNQFNARPYLHESAAPGENATYRLYATTIHNGRLNSGHYTAMASHLKSGRWLRFDDESVHPDERYSVNPSLAYILFYKRC